MGAYEHSVYVNATYGAAELAAVLDICEPEMAAFNYYAGDVYPISAQLDENMGNARRIPCTQRP